MHDPQAEHAEQKDFYDLVAAGQDEEASSDMGPGLAETIDETGSGASTWITKELWGVGSTAPYLHDDRATTLTEAILEHGGDAEDSRLYFEALSTSDQADLIAFLSNLVLFKVEEE